MTGPNPKTNPRCPAPGPSHGTLKAVKRRKCICDGPGHDAMEQYRETQRIRKAAERALPPEHRERRKSPLSWPEAGALERTLLARDDLPCREVDPELFFPIGTSPMARAQERYAKAICRGCAFVDDCLTVALRRGDPWAVMGMTTPAERRAIRNQMSGRAA